MGEYGFKPEEAIQPKKETEEKKETVTEKRERLFPLFEHSRDAKDHRTQEIHVTREFQGKKETTEYLVVTEVDDQGIVFGYYDEYDELAEAAEMSWEELLDAKQSSDVG
ncbi:MAG: hypothetical protein UU48_C0013G0014 [Candidatus Uhrbacteria bacterium GW2011_GWF2_41_16]|uniref:Uncharacterized protein n=2 Tax=Candidatus Uhriibacteriota TaxID=1752732 RepID=A0A0G0V981_9BACT|nr:MAG: hypothetical protein UU35_C0012G0013 [Candidatus Uhrbacteria bacterium GW2011_GWC2_41_11]KKR97524.1 MAG: hypothetical protein UU48_C0013G0014 [Candidatus Uhrbacteria bacterium GW2011_GWF2_41_16]HBP00025.1 hypothetical protein [Candidatus Uhrbacteria bacterium]